MKLALTISGLLNLATVIFLLCRPVRYVEIDQARLYVPKIDSVVLKPEPRVDVIELDTAYGVVSDSFYMTPVLDSATVIWGGSK